MADVKLRSEAPFKYVGNYINCVLFECVYNRIIVFLSIGEKFKAHESELRIVRPFLY